MDFIGGALPNVMFLVGIIAFGVGLGLEFKIIEVKNGLTRGGRIGACLMGMVLMGVSVALYLRPTPPTSVAASTSGVAAAAPAAPSATQLPAAANAAPTATQEQPTATALPPTETALPPTATALPPTATQELPTATTEPTATVASTATAAAPTATAVLPTATTAPAVAAAPTSTEALVSVPDVRGQEPKEAKKLLEQAGLRLGEQREACADLGDNGSKQADVRRGRIACQSVEPGTTVPSRTVIDYALASTKGTDRDD